MFEIQDFTTASDWERLTTSIEQVIHDCRLIHSGHAPLPAGLAVNSDEVECRQKSDIVPYKSELTTESTSKVRVTQDPGAPWHFTGILGTPFLVT